MKYLLFVFLLSSCNTSRLSVVVSPIEAIQLCGKEGVKNYSAISGTIVCGGEG